MQYKKMKLVDCCEFISDGDHMPPPKSESGVPFITISNIKENRIDFQNVMFVPNSYYDNLPETKRVKKGDILYSVVGSYGKPVYVGYDKRLIFQRHIAILRPKKEINSKYLYYAMLDPLFYLKADKLAIGAAQKTITLESLRGIEVQIPSLKEQERVIGVLSKIDEKIDKNRLINDNLQQQLRLMYYYWFTQFDFPNGNGVPYRVSGGKMVSNDILKRDVPYGWEVKNLLDVVSWESNSQPPKSEFVYEPKPGYIRFIQNRDYESNNHITYIPCKKNLSIVNQYDILIDKYGDAGAVRYGIEGAFNVALGKINVNIPDAQEYIRSYLESDGVYSYLHNSCMASTRASLNESNLGMLYIAIPPHDILQKYQILAHRVRSSILQSSAETAQLTNLREWLLPMLMNGQAAIAD